MLSVREEGWMVFAAVFYRLVVRPLFVGSVGLNYRLLGADFRAAVLWLFWSQIEG